MRPDIARPFEGFSEPRYTPVPDEFFDDLMVGLSLAEIRLVLYISRRTFGFKKRADAISLSQMEGGIRRKDGTVLDRGTGLSRRSILPALKSLIEKGIVVREERKNPEHGWQSSVYSLRFKVKTAAPLGESSSSREGENASHTHEEAVSPHNKQDSTNSLNNTPSVPHVLTREFYEGLGRKVSPQKIEAGEGEIESLLQGGFSAEEIRTGIEHIAKHYPDTQTISRLPFLIDEALSRQSRRREAPPQAEATQREEKTRQAQIEIDSRHSEEARTWFEGQVVEEQERLLGLAPQFLSLRSTKIRWLWEKWRRSEPGIFFPTPFPARESGLEERKGA
ncbi:MAG: replication protein [Pseudomonadota bacterium]